MGLVTDKLKCGDIEAGATTDYLDAPSGVWPYAAFRYSWHGRTFDLGVMDWPDTPLPMGSYSYHIQVERYGAGALVKLLSIGRNVLANSYKRTIPPPGTGHR